MADPVMAVVDIGLIVKELAIAVGKRLEASKRLPETVQRIQRTIGQVVGATEDVQLDKPTENALSTIKLTLDKINICLDRLEKTGGRGGKARSVFGRCLGLLAQGQDILQIEQEFAELDAEIKAELSELVKATQLHAYSNRAAGVLKDKSARAFWDRHFKDARSAAGDEVLEALRFECGEAVDMEALEPIVRLALDCDNGGVDGGEAGKLVTVLKFGETFGNAPLLETLKKLSERRSAASHLVQLRMYRLPSKKADDAHSVALLLRVTDTLADLRHAVRKHAAETLEEEGEGSVASFLVDGSFEIYLDKATTRVRRKQEKEMSGRSYLDRACLVRTSDVPSAKRALEASRAAVRLQAGSGGGHGPGDDDTASDAGTEDGTAAARIMEQCALRQAATLSVQSALEDAKLALSLRAHSARLGIGESAVAFLSLLRELSAACAAVAPASIVQSGARLRLAKVGSEALVARFLRGHLASRLPPSCAELIAIANEAHARAGEAGDAYGLLACFDPLKAALEAELEPALLALRKEAARSHKVRTNAGGRARVVVCGGGFAGCLIAADLSAESEQFDVVLVDPKEYFEDVTSVPRACIDPGDKFDGPGDTISSWSRAVCKYTDFVVKNGELVTGALHGVRASHIEVGAARTVVPYDYLVLCTGSSYGSDIKCEGNASLTFRHQQMVAERDALRSAEHVLIVGGGLVGCEVAGEVAEAFPGKRVTLVHAHDRLLKQIKGAHELAYQTLETLGVKMHLGQRVQRNAASGAVAGGGGSFTTSKGARLEADKVIWCTGATPNTAYLRDPEATDPRFTRALDDRGFVKVDASMRVLGFDQVFCCGDILSPASRCAVFASISDGQGGGEVRPERTASAASFSALVVSENIRRLHQGRSEAEVVRFDQRRVGNKQNVAISLGKSMGLLCIDPDTYKAFAGMLGNDFGADVAQIESDSISLASGCTGFKEIITGMIIGSHSDSSALAQRVGMVKASPSYIDPLASAESTEAWAAAVELETVEDLDDIFAPAATPAAAPPSALDSGAGIGIRGGAGGRGERAETIASDASAEEISSLRNELHRKDARTRAHEQEVVALKAELEAARAIASAQMEEMRSKLQQEQAAAMAAMREELENASGNHASPAAVAAAVAPNRQIMNNNWALHGGAPSMLSLPDDASGTAGVAMASAQMLMHQASAAAQVIAALAATVKDLEQGGGRRHEDPASPA